MKQSFLLSGSIAAILLATPAISAAHEANSLVLRVGAVMVEPNEDSSDVAVDGMGSLAGAKVGVDNDTQLGINFTYKFTNNLGIGVLGATPFSHDISGAGSLLSGVGKLGSTKHLPPTITLQYFPLSPNSKVQPYVGVGFNYTTFFQEDTTDNLVGVFESITGSAVADVDMELDDSFGLAAEVGVDYMLTDRIALNAAIWYADIDTEAELTSKFADGSKAKARVDVDIDPMVYMVSVGYKF